MSGPILMYHHIAAPPADAGRHACLFVPRTEFRDHLAALRAMGRATATPEAYCAHLAAPSAGAAPVWITFDDGFLNNYTEAFPELRAAGMTATFFVVVDRVLGGDPAYMTLAMMREMVAAGMAIGSHTLSHPRLARLAPADRRREIVDSKHRLEDALGAPVTSFCYPYGNWDAACVDVVREAGYELATSTIRDNRNTAADRLLLKRVMVAPGRTGWRFRHAFGGLYHLMHAWKNRGRWKPRESRS